MEVKTVVKITEKEIKDWLTEKAREMLPNKGAGMGSTVALNAGEYTNLMCLSGTVTFNGYVK